MVSWIKTILKIYVFKNVYIFYIKCKRVTEWSTEFLLLNLYDRWQIAHKSKPEVIQDSTNSCKEVFRSEDTVKLWYNFYNIDTKLKGQLILHIIANVFKSWWTLFLLWNLVYAPQHWKGYHHCKPCWCWPRCFHRMMMQYHLKTKECINVVIISQKQFKLHQRML